jgi:metal-sulfur cluster biosynthetic enzyme
VVTEEAVRAALEQVNDAHVPVSLRRMGMVAGVGVSADGEVRVRLRMPCMACPADQMIAEWIGEVVSALPGVTEVEVVRAWDEPWDRRMVETTARDLMHAHGIQI